MSQRRKSVGTDAGALLDAIAAEVLSRPPDNARTVEQLVGRSLTSDEVTKLHRRLKVEATAGRINRQKFGRTLYYWPVES